VSPLLAKFVFNPASRNVTLAGANLNNVSFAAIPVFSISGKVKEGTNGLSGVTVTAITSMPPATNTAVSDVNGNYTLSNVRSGSNTVTPSRLDYEFAPANRIVRLGSNTNLQDFVGTHVYRIQGRITENGTGIGVSNVMVTVSNTTVTLAPTNVFTDTDGNYLVTGVRAGTNLLTPVLFGYMFNPAKQTVTVSANRGGVDFSAQGILTISGQIVEGTNGVAGIQVTALTSNHPPNVLPAATSDSNGFYNLTNLFPRVYTVAPQPVGVGFAPVNYFPVNVIANTNLPPFQANPARLTISAPTNGQVNLSLLAIPGRRYTIQGATDLKTAIWSNLVTRLTANDGSSTFADTNGANNPIRFYRTRTPK